MTKVLEEGDQMLSPAKYVAHAIARPKRSKELVLTTAIIQLIITSVLGSSAHRRF